MSVNDKGFQIALEEARAGLAEGGIPVGACVVAADGTVLGRGRNMRVQNGSSILHGETAALANSGRLHASKYEGATMYTTLSPCDMCTGACLLYKFGRVVLGENQTFKGEGEDLLRARGVEVVNVYSDECREMMDTFIKAKPDVW